MKKVKLTLLLLFIAQITWAQSSADRKAVERTGLDYLEGFYQGDTTKLKRSLSPELLKFGYWKNDNGYASEGQMTYQEAIDYALNVKKKGRMRDVPQGSVVVYDIGEQIASIKVKAWWGFDYMLLAKHNGKWKIEHVLWQGPPSKN